MFILPLSFVLFPLSGAFAAVSTSAQSLERRTSIDRDTCSDDARVALANELRRISVWADEAITAVSPTAEGFNPELDAQNRRDFERIFRRRFTGHNRRGVWRAYQAIRDETYRSLWDHRWQDDGNSRITLDCEEFDDYESPCDPFGYGRGDYARSTYRDPNHLLLCPPFFNLDRHLPRNEVEESRVTVLMAEMIDHFGHFFVPGPNPLGYLEASYKLVRFAAAINLRRRDEPRTQDPEWQDEEDRLRQSDDEWADNAIPPPDIEEEDLQYYGSPAPTFSDESD